MKVAKNNNIGMIDWGMRIFWGDSFAYISVQYHFYILNSTTHLVKVISLVSEYAAKRIIDNMRDIRYVDKDNIIFPMTTYHAHRTTQIVRITHSIQYVIPPCQYYSCIFYNWIGLTLHFRCKMLLVAMYNNNKVR